jgi:hypothetical protein
MIYEMIRYDIWYDIIYVMIRCDIPYDTIRYDMIYDMIWYMIRYDIWHDIIYVMIRCDIPYDTIRYDMIYDIWYDMTIWYDVIYLTALGLTPDGSSTVNIYTQTIHRTTQLTWEAYGRCPFFASYTRAFALQLRKKHGKTLVRVAEECQLARWKQNIQNRA